MKILVSGGAGFIGSHVSDAFVAGSHDVVILDDLSTGKLANINPKATFVEGDICDAAFVEELCRENSFDVIDHHAAQIDVRKSVTDPAADAKINIIGSINLMEAARKSGVKHFIFASTGGAIYGEQDYYPADELHPTRAESPYGVAKRAVETYLEYEAKAYGLRHTIFRYSNVYGPRQDPHGEAGVVAIFCSALIEGKQAIIFGDGKQTRDYVFVGDVAAAHLAAIKSSDVSRTLNIATGIETDVNALFTILSENLAAGSASAQYEPARLGEQFRSVCDPSLASRELGWTPKISLQAGLARTADYFKNILSR